MRRLATVLLVSVASSCATGEPRPLRDHEVRAAGEALAKELRTLAVEGQPTLRVVVGAPDALVEEARRRAIECGKFTVSEVEKNPAYALETDVSSGRDAAGPLVTVTFGLIERASHRRVLAATWTGSR